MIKAEMLTIEGVLGACGSHMVPGEYEYNVITCYPESLDHGFRMETIDADDDFLTVYGVEIVEGRDFSKEMIADRNDAALINETAVKKLGWTHPIGKRITDFIDPQKPHVRHIVGVFKDFHHKALYESIAPTMIDYVPHVANKITLKLMTGNIAQTLKQIEQKWRDIAPQEPFEYFFLDDFFNDLYAKEAQLEQIVRVFTILGIGIGCLGLLGLASFTAEQRTKEIGIRKVLGASVIGIVRLLNQNFIKWVLLANLFAWPSAYIIIRKWMEQFPYRIAMSWWIFLLSGLMALAIALLTVSFQTIRSALANPVESLRYE